MRGTPSRWLVVIDLQPAFADPASPWFTPDLPAAIRTIAQLVPLYGEHVVFTRFVPPPTPTGSWRAYYAKWPFALDAETGWLWDVIEPWRGQRSISSHMFSKWEPGLRDLVGNEATLSLCGVSTDCCVLATAFAAVDGGADVRVVVDACAAKSAAVHDRALEIMAARAPQLSLVSAAEEIVYQRARRQP